MDVTLVESYLQCSVDFSAQTLTLYTEDMRANLSSRSQFFSPIIATTRKLFVVT